MIKSIVKIKNFGIFCDYQIDASLPEFKQFNLIYGWNGSGKTTITQLFTSFETGKSQIYPNLEYKIKTANVEFTQKTEYRQQIRVFNRDYISDNIDILSSKAKPIYILGKENKDLIESIKRDEEVLNGDPEKKGDIGKIKELGIKKKELEQKDKDKLFTNVAKIISLNTSAVSARNYRKNDAERAFLGMKEKQLLTSNEVAKHSITLKQMEKPRIQEVLIEDIDKNINNIINCAEVLLQKTIKTVLIERLKNNFDISQWVEKGLTLHIEKKSSNCEFCNQSLPENRILELLSYFNDEDKKIKIKIDTLISEIDNFVNFINKIEVIDKANLYDELQNEYLNSSEKFFKYKDELMANISVLKEEVENKKTNTSNPLKIKSKICLENFISALNEINTEIQNHNIKTNNFSNAKTEATKMLENHYLSETYDDVKLIEVDMSKLEDDINLLSDGEPNNPNKLGISQIQKRIKENRSKISTSEKACEEINLQLKTFLGRDELTFEVEDEGYLIKRKGIIAKNLCEGEKTAIAFVYFTIHLKDQDFNINEGIVVIDDPISSLDSNSLYQAFSFLKNSIKEAKQVFILTHNFDFLRLLLGWLKHSKLINKSEFFMISNPYVGGTRAAKIILLDNLLKNHKSEYHYLFKQHYNFKTDGTIASVYHIPNIARKVLEYFLLIMIPNDENSFTKLENIEFDENKKTAIYKFTNEQSHITGKDFDPSLVQESQNCVKYLLEMIEKTLPKHYQVLVESIKER